MDWELKRESGKSRYWKKLRRVRNLGDRETRDTEKSRALIIQRVLERGHDANWDRLKVCYTMSKG
jgi:hypothetical protein